MSRFCQTGAASIFPSRRACSTTRIANSLTTESRLIIFDTNALNLLPPEGPRADIIRKLRQSKHHRVGVPLMVLEEFAAHQS
jgi:hypothetical protein